MGQGTGAKPLLARDMNAIMAMTIASAEIPAIYRDDVGPIEHGAGWRATCANLRLLAIVRLNLRPLQA